jgi:hypothetical protein
MATTLAVPFINPLTTRGPYFFGVPPVPSTAPAGPTPTGIIIGARPYFNTTIAADYTVTYTFVGWGSVVGPGTIYPLAPFTSLDQALRYYWRAVNAQLSSVAVTSTNFDSSFLGSFSGSFPKAPYSVLGTTGGGAVLRTFGWPASTSPVGAPTIIERMTGLQTTSAPFGVASGFCGIFPPLDTSGVSYTNPLIETPSGPVTNYSSPCGKTSTLVIAYDPVTHAPIYYVAPVCPFSLILFPNQAPILFDPAEGYYVPMILGTDADPLLPVSSPGFNYIPSSLNMQELTTSVTDYTTPDFDGDPLVTTYSPWTTSAFTWTLDGISGAAFDPAPITYAYPAGSEEIQFQTYSGEFAFQTFDT